MCSRYLPVADGTAGFVDFAVGHYDTPLVGLEFYLGYGWAHEHPVFDFLKLLNGKKPFEIVMSPNVILRETKLSKGERLESLEDHMDEAYHEATERLVRHGKLCSNSQVYFLITEISAWSKGVTGISAGELASLNGACPRFVIPRPRRKRPHQQEVAAACSLESLRD